LKLPNRQIFTAYIIIIVVAEVVTSFVDLGYGFLFHSVILISLLVLSSLKQGENPSSGLYLSLTLAPFIRIISLSMQVQVMSDILLILLLASKEMVSTDTRQTLKAFDKALTIVILPLLILFILNVSSKVLEVL